MVPCSHQGNIYTERKLRVWRDQKCIPLVGAKTILICACRQNTQSRLMRYRAKTGKLRKLGRPIALVPCLHQGNIYTKRKLRVWRDKKCIPLVSAITPLTYAGRQSTPSRWRKYRARNGKLRKFGRTYRHGTVFVPRQYLYQKEATGMERPQMYSASRCNNCTYLYGPSKYPVSRKFRAQNGKLRKLGRTYRHGTACAPRQYLCQKEATGMERPEMHSASW